MQNLFALLSEDASGVGQIELWTVADETVSRVGDPVTSGGQTWTLAFSADGQVLATGGDNGVRFWDVSDSTIPRPLGGRLNLNTETLRFAPDGRTLLSTYADSTVLWPMSPEDWSDRACNIAGRNLTQNEWLQYVSDLPYHLTCAQWPEGK